MKLLTARQFKSCTLHASGDLMTLESVRNAVFDKYGQECCICSRTMKRGAKG
jgi:hypothetical protein